MKAKPKKRAVAKPKKATAVKDAKLRAAAKSSVGVIDLMVVGEERQAALKVRGLLAEALGEEA